MSWKRGQQAGRRKRSSWSGESVSQDTPRHRWQDSTSSSDVDRTRRRSRNRWVSTAVIALALLALLIWFLPKFPRTPFILIAETKYDAPIPINGWAREDCDAFRALNKRNILFQDHELERDTKSDKVEFLPKSFNANKGQSDIPLVVYVSMHGVVKDSGEPCLLPSGASFNEPKEWIPVANVLDEIGDKVLSTRDTLLVLDCNRIRMNWSMGIVYNTFADRLQELVDKHVKELAKQKKYHRLAVLMSAGPGQINWTSPDLRGSVFGHYLQLGLAGAADERDSGDGDGKVQLLELAAYLKQAVSAWSQYNRGEPQEPMLIPGDADFHVTYAIKDGFFGKIFQRVAAGEHKNPEHEGSQESIESRTLWKQFDNLRSHDLVRCDPIACRNFEHQLLRLEEYARGGKEYVSVAKTLRDNAVTSLATMTKHLSAMSARSPSAADYYGVWKNSDWLRLKNVAFSLPASEYFASCDDQEPCNDQEREKIREMWKQLIDISVAGDADAIVSATGVPKMAQNLGETQFLAALRQQQVARLWENKIDLASVFDRRSKSEQVAMPREPNFEQEEKASQPRESESKSDDHGNQSHEVVAKPGDERAHYFTRVAAAAADERRRILEDLLFVGPKNVPAKYGIAAQEYVEMYEWTTRVMEDGLPSSRRRICGRPLSSRMAIRSCVEPHARPRKTCQR
jgi:hypothetical protein